MPPARVMRMSFAPPPKKQPVEPDTAPELDFDQDEPLDDADPFAEDDALAAMDPADFYRQLRAQVEQVAAGEIPGGLEDAHPGPKDRPRSKRYTRRDKHG
jgi:hypothetical protein